MSKRNTLVAALVLAIVSHSPQAALLVWPNGVCTGTLQACVDAASPGDEVRVNTDTPVAESITINKSLRILGGYGYAAGFASGYGITVATPVTGDSDVRVSRFRLTNARVDVQHGGSGVATVYIQDNQFRSVGAVAAGIRVRGVQTAGRVVAYILHNTLDVAVPTSADAAIEIELGSNGAAGNSFARMEFNTVRATADSEGWGVVLNAIAGTTSSTMLFNNQIYGRFARGGLMLSEGLFSNTPSTLSAQVVNNVLVGKSRRGGGVTLVVNRGTLNTTLLNNTLVHLAYGAMHSQWCCDNTATAQITTKLQSNLVAYNDYGLRFQAGAFGASRIEFTNLVFGNNQNAPTSDPQRLVADPLLDDRRHPSLRSGSPAIDAGQTVGTGGASGSVDLDVYYTTNGLKQVDADGLRRVKGGGPLPLVDIGAFEFGDEFAREVNPQASPAFSSIPIESANMPTASSAVILSTLYAGSLGTGSADPIVSSSNPIGVWWFGAWYLIQENGSDMPGRIRFNVFAPYVSQSAYVHAVPAAENLSYTVLDPTKLHDSFGQEALASRMLFVTHNQDPGGTTATADNHFLGVAFTSGNWRVHHVDNTEITDGTDYNVYSVAENPNAYPANAILNANIFGRELELDHVLLNGVPCARFIVTPRHADVAWGNSGLDVYYNVDRGRWRIYRFDPTTLVAGSVVNVLIDAKQTALCRDLLSDGFED